MVDQVMESHRGRPLYKQLLLYTMWFRSERVATDYFGVFRASGTTLHNMLNLASNVCILTDCVPCEGKHRYHVDPHIGSVAPFSPRAAV